MDPGRFVRRNLNTQPQHQSIVTLKAVVAATASCTALLMKIQAQSHQVPLAVPLLAGLRRRIRLEQAPTSRSSARHLPDEVTFCCGIYTPIFVNGWYTTVAILNKLKMFTMFEIYMEPH